MEKTARDALDDMRRLLDLLRATDLGGAGAELTPSIGLDQVATLVEQARRAGLELQATIECRCPQHGRRAAHRRTLPARNRVRTDRDARAH